MLGSWNKADVASKLKKYRAKITAARNHQIHAAIEDQIRKYAKWKPNSCYEMLVRAECLIANRDVHGAEKLLEAGLALGESGADAMEALMWMSILAYIAGDFKSSLK